MRRTGKMPQIDQKKRHRKKYGAGLI